MNNKKMKFHIQNILFDNEISPIGHPNVTFFENNAITEDDTFYFASIKNCLKLRRDGVQLLKFFDLSPIVYMPFMLKHIIGCMDSCFKIACNLNSNDIGKFIKPNSGYKLFAGQIIRDEHDLEAIRQLTTPDQVVYLAPVVKIEKEFRFWIINEEIVTYSQYFPFTFDNSQQYTEPPEDMFDYVNTINDIWQPDDMFTVDIGQLPDGKYGVVEYNCLSCSGFYNANWQKIIEKIVDKYI